MFAATRAETSTAAPVESGDLSGLIASAATAYGISPSFLAAQVQAESGGDPNIVSSAGAVGLLQLMPDAAAEMGVVDRTSPEQNLNGGAGYLVKQLQNFGGDPAKAIAAYHAGPGNVRKAIAAGGDNWLQELGPQTNAYVAKLLPEWQAAPAPVVPTRFGANASELPQKPRPRFGITKEDFSNTEPRAHPAQKVSSQLGGTFARGVRRGTKQSKGLYGQLLKTIGDEAGFAGMIEVGDELIEESFVEALRNPARIQDLSEVTSLSKAGTFFWQTLGEQIPNLALAATGAGFGAGLAGFATRAAVTRAALNNVAKNAVKQGIDPTKAAKAFFAKGTATRAAARKLSPTALKVGAAGGTFGAFLPINTGEIIQEQRDAFEASVDEAGGYYYQHPDTIHPPKLGPSLALGAASSALEVLGFGIAGQAIFGKAKKEVVEHMVKTVLRRVGHASLKSLAGEGGTEAVQEVLVIASRKINDPTFSITDAITSSEGLSRIAFAGVSGAVVGAAIGGGGGVATGVADAARFNIRRADINGRFNSAIDAVRNSVPSGQDEEVLSLFDIPLAMKDAAKGVASMGKAGFAAIKAIKLREAGDTTHTTGSIRQGVNAAKARFKIVSQMLKDERDTLSEADGILLQKQAEFVAALTGIEAVVAQLPVTSELGGTPNKAIQKAAKETQALLAELNKLSGDKRAARAHELLEKAQQLLNKAQFDPTGVAKVHIDKLLKRAVKYVEASHKKSQKQSKKYHETLNMLRIRAAKAINRVRVADKEITAAEAAQLTPEETAEDLAVQEAELAGRAEDSGETTGDQLTVEEVAEDRAVRAAEREGRAEDSGFTPTPEAEIVASAYQVLKARRDFAFAIGKTIATLPATVRQLVESGKLEAIETSKEVILNLPGAFKSVADAKQRSFTTQVEEIDPESAAIVKTDSKREVTPRDKVPEVVAKLEAEGEETTIFPEADMAATEQIEELNAEAEAKGFVAIKISKANAETLRTDDTEIFVRAPKSNRLMHAYIDIKGNLRREDGGAFKLFSTLKEAAKAAKNKTTVHKVEGSELQFFVVKDAFGQEQYVVRSDLRDGRSQIAERQVRHALERGEERTRNKVLRTISAIRSKSKKAKKPATVRFHAGEITALGLLLDTAGSQHSQRGRYANPQTHFLDGLSYIMSMRDSEGNALFNIEFNPTDKIVDGKRIKGNPVDANKQVFGTVAYKDAGPSQKKAVPRTVKSGTEKATIGYVEWALNKVEVLGEHPRLLRGLLWNYGLISKQEIAELSKMEPEIEADLGKTIMDGIRLMHTNIIPITDPIVYERGEFASGPATTQPGSGQQQLFDNITTRVVFANTGPSFGGTGKSAVTDAVSTALGRPQGKGRSTLRDSQKGEFVDVEEHEFQDAEFLKPSYEDHSIKISGDKVQEEGLGGVPYVYGTSLRDQNLGFSQHAPHKSTGQLQNFITKWPAAQAAVEYTMKMLNLKEKVVLYDEDNASLLISIYKLEEHAEGNSAERTALYRGYRERIEQVLIDKPPGRIVGPPQSAKGNDRVTHIFVTNGTTNHSRGRILMHEVGHLVQYTHLDRLSPRLQALVLDAMDGNTEIFADYMARVAADLHFGRKVRAGTEVDNIFIKIVEELKKVWDALRALLKYDSGFDHFVAALNSHAAAQRLGDISPAAGQRAEQVIPPKNPIAREIFFELQALKNSGAIQGPTTADFPANRSKLSGYFNKGKQRYKNLKAKRAQRKQEHQARLVPEDKWWANAPSGKKLDLTDPTVKKILEEHNHWTLVNAPETQPWSTRSKFIAEHLIHSKLVTKTEFLAAALAARRDAEAQFMSGKLTLGQLKETDLRNKLIAIIDKRVAKGDYWDLVASITETLPGELDYARNDPQTNAMAGFKDGVYEPPSARVVANSIWSRNNKPTVEELFSEAEAEIFSDMAEAHQEGESFSVVEALANMAGYLSERYGVEITEDQLTDFIESSELVKGDLTKEEAARIEDEKGLALEEERADDGGFGDYPDEDDFTVADFTVQGVIDRSDNPFFGHWVDNAKEWAAMLKENPVRAFSHLVRMADSELRSMGPIGLWIAQQFRAMPGQKEASDTVFRMVQMKAGPHHAALKVLLDSLESPRIGLWEGIFNKHPTNIMKAKRAHRDKVMEALLLQKKPAELSADIKSEVEAVRKYLKNLYDWYTGSTGTTFVINGVKMKGMNLKLTERGFKDEVSTYYPMMFDTLFLDKNRGKFEGIAKKYGFADEDATNMRVKLTRDEDGGLNNGFHTDAATDQFFGPGAAFTQQRVKEWPLEMRDELVREGFYHKDLSVTLTAYTEMMVRRAVWQRRFGETDFGPVNFARYKAAGIEDSIHSPVAKLLLKVEEGYKKGELIEWQYKRIINDILPAYAGQLGLRTNSKLRNISAGVTIYNNLRLLPFAIFAQYVDVGTMINRGDFKAFEASLQGMLNKSTREDVRTMLTVLGAIRDGVTEHALNDQALNTFMTGNAKRINDTFFRYNLMEGWTNGIRVMAAIAGREFIMRHSRLALREGNKKSQKYMDNLGLGDPEGLAAAAVWDGFTTDNEQISAGLLRYVDESMIRPDATIRPVHVSDPGYMIFNHLKGFLWNFHGTFIQHAVHEAKVHQNLLPLFTLGMMALPFAAVGYELRRWVTNFGEPPPRLEGASYMIELVERGGLLGPWQLVADMEQADAFGKPFVLGAAGPAAEQLFDFYDKDLAKWLPRALPVVASMPPLRRGMRDILSKE